MLRWNHRNSKSDLVNLRRSSFDSERPEWQMNLSYRFIRDTFSLKTKPRKRRFTSHVKIEFVVANTSMSLSIVYLRCRCDWKLRRSTKDRSPNAVGHCYRTTRCSWSLRQWYARSNIQWHGRRRSCLSTRSCNSHRVHRNDCTLRFCCARLWYQVRFHQFVWFQSANHRL